MLVKTAIGHIFWMLRTKDYVTTKWLLCTVVTMIICNTYAFHINFDLACNYVEVQ